LKGDIDAEAWKGVDELGGGKKRREKQVHYCGKERELLGGGALGNQEALIAQKRKRREKGENIVDSNQPNKQGRTAVTYSGHSVC